MPNPPLPLNRPRRNPFAGLIPIVVAVILTVLYFRLPRVTSKWPLPAHVLYRGIVVAIGLMGVSQIVSTLANRRIRFPSWMRLTQHWTSIPLEGWIYLGIMVVLFTGAMLTKQNTLLLVFAFMAGPFVINGWMTFGMLQSARIQRNAPKRAMEGEMFSVELALSNTRPLFAIWMMAARDEIENLHETLEATVLFSRVSPRSSQSGQYQLRLARRGRYRMGPLRISSRFPLGLVERSRVLPAAGEILIYPRIGRISPQWRQRLIGATELVSRIQPHQGVFHDDFHRLREFRPGDNPRAIHWRSTARRGELILREFHQNREHRLAIVLDLFAPPGAKRVGNDTVEFALSFVASLLVERGRECRDGYLSLAASGDQVFHWEGQATSSSLEALFDGLAVLQAGPAAEIATTLNHTLLHCSTSTQILVVTTRESSLPYKAHLTPRIDVLNLNEIPRDSLLIF